MIKILHTADWHLGKRLQEFSRIEEQKLVLEEIIEVADQENVDLVLLAGDIFDTFNPNHEAVELLYKTLRRLSKNGERPIIAISGNHDSTQFVEAPDPLARELGILFYSRYDSIIPIGKLDSGIEITKSASGFVELKLPKIEFPVRIILAPYANENLLKTYLGEGDREAEFREILQENWLELADNYCDDNGVNLFIGHFFFMKEGESSVAIGTEAEPESERPILHVGGTQALFTKNIPSQIQYAALGHLHRYHSVGHEHCPVVYSSSPLAYSFSEADQEKKVVILKAAPNQEVEYHPVGLKQGRPLYRKKFDNLPETLAWLEENPYCFVEITYVTEHSIDAATRKAIMKAHDGIVNLIPQINNPAGTEDLSLQVEDLGKDMSSLFQLFYKSEKGQEPNEELMEIFREVISQNKEV
ncbi:metallophosphoesterase family protein [Algoriphagus machipongonensis]|uniref:Nuclease SbcCD subunit D n=1 Tax=Algoriphagus machipongonensis TaxID=388413 RepID=A3HX94_9BACT|nr:exonuclease subunit SbcD [Algoriphagus machipongonensis]EAZ81217.1 DNA repair exonuclease [Algoriphagus machipongonensis]